MSLIDDIHSWVICWCKVQHHRHGILQAFNWRPVFWRCTTISLVDASWIDMIVWKHAEPRVISNDWHNFHVLAFIATSSSVLNLLGFRTCSISEMGLVRIGAGVLVLAGTTIRVAKHLPYGSSLGMSTKLLKIYWCNCDVKDQFSADDNHDADDGRY